MKKTVEHIHTISTCVRGPDGTQYEARILGERRDDGTWSGWIEFHAQNDSGRVLTTGQETSQPDRRALDYWSGGLEPIYLEGALERARQ